MPRWRVVCQLITTVRASYKPSDIMIFLKNVLLHKIMKKFICKILAVSILLSLSSCSEDNSRFTDKEFIEQTKSALKNMVPNRAEMFVLDSYVIRHEKSVYPDPVFVCGKWAHSISGVPQKIKRYIVGWKLTSSDKQAYRVFVFEDEIIHDFLGTRKSVFSEKWKKYCLRK